MNKDYISSRFTFAEYLSSPITNEIEEAKEQQQYYQSSTGYYHYIPQLHQGWPVHNIVFPSPPPTINSYLLPQVMYQNNIPTSPIPEQKQTMTRPRGRRVSNIPNNGVRTFACKTDGCGKVFKRSEHLKRHTRSIHTMEKRKLLLNKIE
jgi:hypothetical protein